MGAVEMALVAFLGLNAVIAAAGLFLVGRGPGQSGPSQ